MKKRIIGIDVARALAIMGMILVNFKIGLGTATNNTTLLAWSSFFEGKAAATFVVLAGIGISLMAKSVQSNASKLKHVRTKLFKRVCFLWIIGLLFTLIWPADILHYYAVYILITTLLLTASDALIWCLIICLILGYPFLFLVTDYEQSWNWETLEYVDFWTLEGFFRNLFFNGFHPVVPWLSFMLLGLWMGRQNLNNLAFISKVLIFSVLVFISIQGLSSFSLSKGVTPDLTLEEMEAILGTSPMPPFPFYMISGSSFALLMVSICILIAGKLEQSIIIKTLAKTGQLALTFYIAHVVLGLALIDFLLPYELGSYSLEFALMATLIFSLCCMFFAHFWRKYYAVGPLEWLMRKITT